MPKAIEEAVSNNMQTNDLITVWIPPEIKCPELRVPPISSDTEIGFDIELLKIERNGRELGPKPKKDNSAAKNLLPSIVR